jgi:hypothetical protein
MITAMSLRDLSCKRVWLRIASYCSTAAHANIASMHIALLALIEHPLPLRNSLCFFALVQLPIRANGSG